MNYIRKLIIFLYSMKFIHKNTSNLKQKQKSHCSQWNFFKLTSYDLLLFSYLKP